MVAERGEGGIGSPSQSSRSSAFRVRLNAGNVLFWLTDFLIVMLQRAKQTAGEGGSLTQGGVVTGHTMAIKCISLSDQRHARCGPPSAFAFCICFCCRCHCCCFWPYSKLSWDKLSGR